MSKQYCVYMLTNHHNTTLYIGITSHLHRRVEEHRQKLVEGFSLRYNLMKLVYYEVYDSPDTAIAREKQLKGWIRKRKDVLIGAVNPEWKDLYNEGEIVTLPIGDASLYSA
jgi:putative endonuclease